MSVQDLEHVVDRILDDQRFRVQAEQSIESLCLDYALSEDEIAALRTRDRMALLALGLDESRAELAAHLI
ncbi:MAG: hypothetical protein U0821_14175 [Chloroflexota bacterium]